MAKRKIKVKSKVAGVKRDICTILLTEYVENLHVRFEDQTEIQLAPTQNFELLAQAGADLSYQLSRLFREGFLEPEPQKEPRSMDDEKPNELGNSRTTYETVKQRNLQWSPSWSKFFEYLTSVFLHLGNLEAIEPPRICNPWEYCANSWDDRELLIILEHAVKHLETQLKDLNRELISTKDKARKRQKIISSKCHEVERYQTLIRSLSFLRTCGDHVEGKPTTLEEYLQIEKVRRDISRAVSDEKQHQSQHEFEIKYKLPPAHRHIGHDGKPVDSSMDDSFSSKPEGVNDTHESLWDESLKRYFFTVGRKGPHRR